jgi:predicted anti-sigma-YlaC factor YlaD
MPEDDDMPASVKAAILPVVVALLALIAGYLKSDAHAVSDQLTALGTAITGLVIAVWIWVDSRGKIKKIDRAESIMPGVTSVPKGSVTSATLTVNHPETPDPPATITNDNPRTP